MELYSGKRFERGRMIAVALALILLGGVAWASLAPLETASREELFQIPSGTSARRMAGEKIDILPQTIRLTIGLKDVLVLRNADKVPHIFGPTLIMPGQSFSLPFTTASTYSFLCTAHPSGTLDVIVDPSPSPGWQRLRWRLRSLIGLVSADRHVH